MTDWKLVVPREPTEAMQKAGVEAMFDMDHSDLKWREAYLIVRKGWRAMCDAARPDSTAKPQLLPQQSQGAAMTPPPPVDALLRFAGDVLSPWPDVLGAEWGLELTDFALRAGLIEGREVPEHPWPENIDYGDGMEPGDTSYFLTELGKSAVAAAAAKKGGSGA